MKKVKVRVEKDENGDWWVQSEEVVGLFVCGETQEEALENAKFAIGMELDIDEDTIRLKIVK